MIKAEEPACLESLYEPSLTAAAVPLVRACAIAAPPSGGSLHRSRRDRGVCRRASKRDTWEKVLKGVVLMLV